VDAISGRAQLCGGFDDALAVLQVVEQLYKGAGRDHRA
jgi:hypothetical protein